MPAVIHLLGPDDASVLDAVAPGVFDKPVRPEFAREFLQDPRHHLAVAIDQGRVVGMASGVTYLHPDKPVQLFVNEVGVADTHARRGIGLALVRALLDHGGTLGCAEAWVATEQGNAPARALYARAGGNEAADSAVVFEFRIEPRT